MFNGVLYYLKCKKPVFPSNEANTKWLFRSLAQRMGDVRQALPRHAHFAAKSTKEAFASGRGNGGSEANEHAAAKARLGCVAHNPQHVVSW